MNPVVKNILAVVGGIVVGSVVNMALIKLSPIVIPPPEGADFTTMEGLQASMHLMESKHYIMPWLAHALGTFAGALIACKLSASHHERFAYVIAFFFLLGGIANVTMLPSPMWFNVADLALAYIPMGWLATKL